MTINSFNSNMFFKDILIHRIISCISRHAYPPIYPLIYILCVNFCNYFFVCLRNAIYPQKWRSSNYSLLLIDITNCFIYTFYILNFLMPLNIFILNPYPPMLAHFPKRSRHPIFGGFGNPNPPIRLHGAWSPKKIAGIRIIAGLQISIHSMHHPGASACHVSF